MAVAASADDRDARGAGAEDQGQGDRQERAEAVRRPLRWLRCVARIVTIRTAWCGVEDTRGTTNDGHPATFPQPGSLTKPLDPERSLQPPNT